VTAKLVDPDSSTLRHTRLDAGFEQVTIAHASSAATIIPRCDQVRVAEKVGMQTTSNLDIYPIGL
jgi:hypothetical protein